MHRDKLAHAEEERRQLIQIVDENINTKEKEVRLRVDFENKINNMHAINRVTEERLERALEDIGTLLF